MKGGIIGTKQLVIIVVIIEIIAAASIVVLQDKHDKDALEPIQRLSLIARVNTDGSGIYIRSGYNADDFLTVSESGDVEYKSAAWGGKVFGTPGASTLQHIQMMEIVREKLNLRFEKFDYGSERSSDTVYFVDNITNYTGAVNNYSILDGGIIWEPQYQYIISDSRFGGMITSDILFPDHVCCVIAARQGFLDGQNDTAVRFLAAFVKATAYINDAKKDPGSKEFDRVVEIGLKSIKGIEEPVLRKALMDVVYRYSDEDGGSDLTGLEKDVAILTERLTDIGAIKLKISELGFASYEQFADVFIDSSYLEKALDHDTHPGDGKVTVNVSTIDGDVHHLALRVADELGYFAQYGIEVNIKTMSGGGIVAQDILSGQTDLGLLGVTPITSATVNGKAIIVKGDSA